MVSSVSLAKDKGYLIRGYYTNENEGPGHWVGTGSKRLALQGEVNPDEFGQLWDGYSPDGTKKLVQNAGKERRQAGWDFTFSPPKDVSILHGLGDEKTRLEVENAQNVAVSEGLNILESAGFSRAGKAGGLKVKTDGLIAASFQHNTNRENQPQLHNHVMVFNVASRSDGSTGSIISKRLYNANLAAGSVHTARLATELQKLGYEVKPTREGFNIAGIPDEAREAFSLRSAQISAYLEKHQLDDTPQNRDKAAEVTRSAKKSVAWETLRTDWQTVGATHGLTPGFLGQLRGQGQELSKLQIEEAKAQVIEKALAKPALQNQFNERDLEVAISQSAIGKGLTLADIKDAKEDILSSKKFKQLEADSYRGKSFAPRKPSVLTTAKNKILEKVEARRERLRDIEANKFLSELDNKGQLVISNDEQLLKERLISDWMQAGGPDGNLIISNSEKEVKRLNLMAQSELKQDGALGRQTKIGRRRYHQGDKIQFKETDREWGLYKGETGKITKVNSPILNRTKRDLVTVSIGNRTVTFDRKKYKNLSLDYASTPKDAKGNTDTNNSYIYSKGRWSRSDAQRAVNVAEENTRVYGLGTSTEERKRAIERLAKNMSDEQHKLAQERLEQHQRQEHP